VRPLGVTAAIGLVQFFAGALAAHVRARAFHNIAVSGAYLALAAVSAASRSPIDGCPQLCETFPRKRFVKQRTSRFRGCRARLACLVGALERGEPWGVWGGELLLRGAIVPRKRPRGRPRTAVVPIAAG